MKRSYPYLLLFLALIAGAIIVINLRSDKESDLDEARAVHEEALKNSPFKNTKNLTKQERKKLALPPNAYFERLWELTMDPYEGRPMYERLAKIQQQLDEDRQQRGVGGDASNPWIDRGPTGVLANGANNGGRTRAIMFDPTDPTNRKVFSGGVSGGLWVNNDITNAASGWTLVPGIGANISVNVMISDPNNPSTFYIGTGESYTSGAVIGRGIWKSTDAGVTWTNIWGGYTGTSNGNQQIDGIFYINDLVARNNGGSTELYAAVGGAFYGDSSSPGQFHSLSEQGIYKSVDGGVSWTKSPSSAFLEANGTPSNPNDIELDINNNIWVTTTRSSWGFNGGRIIQSTDGNSWSIVNTIPNARRTELEPSPSNANVFWVLIQDATPATFGEVDIYTTTDAFNTFTRILTEPNDADPGIPAGDFTRGQAFYDLVIESDQSGNLIVGGIDLFRSTNGGGSWGQMSEWYNIFGLTASYTHADIHGAYQRPGSPNEWVFATDGGVFYCSDVTTAVGNASAIQARNLNYNTLQFYYGDISSVINGPGDDLVGGTQDNGTPAVYNAAAGANGFTDITGGDGGFTEIDDAGAYIITAYPRNNHYVIVPPSSFYQISSGSGGNFINEGALDKNLDILYTNSVTGGPTYRIERISNFISGAGSVVQTQLTNAALNANISAMKVSPYTTGSTKLFVGLENGRLIRIDNADTTPTWTVLTTPFLGSISDIELGQSDNEIFVTMHNYGVNSVFRSPDAGVTWLNVEGNLPDLPVKCILQNPLIPQEVIIGTDLGIWATADITVASPSWVQAYNGMSDVTVLDLDLRASDNVILATTHGRGMFTSQFTSSPLSVVENSLAENTISIYPTVSDGNFTLDTKRALGDVDFRIYDLTGKQVYADQFEMNDQKDFQLSLNSGLYLVKVKTERAVITKRILIK